MELARLSFDGLVVVLPKVSIEVRRYSMHAKPKYIRAFPFPKVFENNLDDHSSDAS